MNPQPAPDPIHELILNYHNEPNNQKAIALVEELFKSDNQNREMTGMAMAGIIDGLFDSASDALNWSDENPTALLNRSAEARNTYPPNGPGWNDYFMAHWMVSRSENALETIVRRLRGVGFNQEVQLSAQWMVRSISRMVPDFQEALQLQQARMGFSTDAPPEFAGPMPAYGFLSNGGGATGLEPYMAVLQKWFESMMPSEAKTEAKRSERQKEMDDEDERRIGVAVYLDELANGNNPHDSMDKAEEAISLWILKRDQRRQAAEPKAE